MSWKLAPLLFLLCAAAASGAQVYEWKDDKGIRHFSDTPPPPSVSKVKVQPGDHSAPESNGLPYALAEAVKRHPVLLYTGSQCDACDQGRALLQARGIPFQERTVDSSADLAALNRAGGAGKLPLLLIGNDKRSGFEAGAWNAALSAASYPVQRRLPPSYQAPPSLPAAPPLPAAAPAIPSEPDQLPSQKPPPLNAPPNFQF